MSRNTLLQDIVVGLVFVHISKADAQHISKRIPPLKHLYKSEQHDIPRVTVLYVPHFVQHNLATSFVEVFLADDNIAHPAEWRHFFCVAIDANALFILLPEDTFAQSELQVTNLPKPHRKQNHHTYYIYKAHEEEEAETRGFLTRGTVCNHLNLRQYVNRNAQLEHLKLGCLHDWLVVERHPRHVAKRQSERQKQDSQQYQAIEAEETLPPKHQHIGQIQHCQHQSRLYGI